MKQPAGRYHYAPSRRRWGQNFLRDRSVAERIVAAIAPGPGDFFLEIGPGEGVLTVPLAEAAASVVAVEIDPLMASLLREGPARRCPTLHILEADALEVGPEQVLELLGHSPNAGQKLRLAGNLPFNVSVPLIRRWMDRLDRVADMTFMVQREVAQRMTAAPGEPAYGFLSLLVQLHCEARPLLEVKRIAFRPRPNVDATVVRLEPREGPELPAKERSWLLEVISLAFRSRRKTLFNNLRGDTRFTGMDGPLENLLRGQGLDRNRRGETLPLEAFIDLARELAPLAAPTAGGIGNDAEEEEKDQD